MEDILRLKQFGERHAFPTPIILNKLNCSIKLSLNYSLEFQKHGKSLTFGVKQVKPSKLGMIINE